MTDAPKPPKPAAKPPAKPAKPKPATKDIVRTSAKTEPPPKMGMTAEEYLEIGQKLTPEARAELHHMGMTVPLGVDENEGGVARWGVRCPPCNGIQLEILGNRFGPEGDLDCPPKGTPLASLPWTQSKLPPQNVNRGAPKCQECGAQANLDHLGCLKTAGPPEFGVVDIEAHKAMLAREYSPAVIAEQRRIRAKLAVDPQLPSGRMNVNISTREIHAASDAATGRAPGQTAANLQATADVAEGELSTALGGQTPVIGRG